MFSKGAALDSSLNLAIIDISLNSPENFAGVQLAKILIKKIPFNLSCLTGSKLNK